MRKYFIGLLLLFCCRSIFGETHQHIKLWSGSVFVGSLSDNNKIKYYLQPQLVLIDNKYKFHSSFFFVGLGYRPEFNITFWLMNGYAVDKRSNGSMRHTDILREQLNYIICDNSLVSLTSVSRLEERKDLDESAIWLRARQMFSARLPFKNWEKHSFSCFDELFFNFNHPAWTDTNTFVEQNRVFVGIGTQITKYTVLDIGYMNQYQFKNTDANSHVLYAYLNVFG